MIIAREMSMALFRIHFATDAHGSTETWKKFVNSASLYKTNISIMGGDLTGKAIVPIIEHSNGKYRCSYLGMQFELDSEEKLKDLERTIALTGYYGYRTTQGEMEDLEANPKKMDDVFLRLMMDRIKEWMDYADEKLRGTDRQCFVCPGNDDRWEIDPIIDGAKFVVNVSDKIVEMNPYHELLSMPWSNPTPWNTHKELSEEEYAKKIGELVAKVKDMSQCVWNIHVPPYGSGLDDAPVLDKDLKVMDAGQSRAPVGSTAVRDAVMKYQPLVGLFGHIHESRSFRKLGKTLCLNPGSSYGEGILQGVLVNIDEKGLKSYVGVVG